MECICGRSGDAQIPPGKMAGCCQVYYLIGFTGSVHLGYEYVGAQETGGGAMKRIIFSILLEHFESHPVFCQAKQAQIVSQQIIALENAWNEATRKYDASWYERNLGDLYLGTDEDGVVKDKAAMIATVKSREAKLSSLAFEKIKVQVYGDTAIFWGIYVVKGTYKGRDISGKYPLTDTWVKVNGRWHCVADHNSKLPAK